MANHPWEVGGLIGLTLAVFAAGLWALSAFARQQQPFVLSPLRQRAMPWSAGWCIVVFMLMWMPQACTVNALRSITEKGSVDIVVRILVGISLLPFQALAFMLFLRYQFNATHRLGDPTRRGLLRDGGLGLVASLIMATPTLVTHTATRLWLTGFGEQAVSENPLINELRTTSVNEWLWLLVATEAVLCAPVREELFFRGTLQPVLCRHRYGGELALCLAILAPVFFFPRGGSYLAIAVPAAYAAIAGLSLMAAERPLLHLRSWLGIWGRRLVPDVVGGAETGRPIFRGIIGTSILFAMFHSTSWPDPVALTLIGLTFGWLGWRTQSVVAPMVCHALFNGYSLVVLRWTVLFNS